MKHTSTEDAFADLRRELSDLAAALAIRRQRSDEVWQRTLADRTEKRLYDAEKSLFDAVGGVRSFRGEIERSIEAVWSIHFGWLDIATSWMHALSQGLAEDERVAAVPDELALAHAEVSIRAVSVGHEILALLRAGYPRGAHARWRTLYELSVVSEVLLEGGRRAAARFLNHREVQIGRDAEYWLPNADSRPERRLRLGSGNLSVGTDDRSAAGTDGRRISQGAS